MKTYTVTMTLRLPAESEHDAQERVLAMLRTMPDYSITAIWAETPGTQAHK